jgi:hypothetical protein
VKYVLDCIHSLEIEERKLPKSVFTSCDVYQRDRMAAVSTALATLLHGLDKITTAKDDIGCDAKGIPAITNLIKVLLFLPFSPLGWQLTISRCLVFAYSSAGVARKKSMLVVSEVWPSR